MVKAIGSIFSHLTSSTHVSRNVEAVSSVHPFKAGQSQRFIRDETQQREHKIEANRVALEQIQDQVKSKEFKKLTKLLKAQNNRNWEDEQATSSAYTPYKRADLQQRVQKLGFIKEGQTLDISV